MLGLLSVRVKVVKFCERGGVFSVTGKGGEEGRRVGKREGRTGVAWLTI